MRLLLACLALAACTTSAPHTTLYLVTDGATLSPSDTPLVGGVSAVIPPLLPGEPGRHAVIETAAADVQQALAPYAVDVVTERPATGDFTMIVLGGAPSLVGALDTTVSLAPSSCGGERVALVFDKGQVDYVNAILGDVGMLAGLAAADVDGDCMCRTSACVAATAERCRFSPAAATDPGYSCGRATQDEPGLLADAFGWRDR